MYESFEFKKDQEEATFNFGFRSPEIKEVSLKFTIIPYCYPKNMELVVDKKMSIYEPMEKVRMLIFRNIR